MSSETSNAESPDRLTTTPASATTTTEYQYRCPVCSATYQNEMLARCHLTRLEDDDHITRNGLMPEAEIEVVDITGTVVDTISRHPSEMDPTAVTVDALPNDLSEVNKHVVLTAVHNPETRTKTDITELVEDRLADEPLQVPAYRTVAAVLTRMFDPNRSKTTKGDDLASLTTKQQAVVTARLAAPNADKAALATMTGISANYPRYVLDRATHVISDLRETVESADGDLVAVLRDELSDRALAALIEQGHLDDVPVDTAVLQQAVDDSDGPEATDDAAEDAQTVATESTAQSEELSQWGSPVGESTGLSAAPDVESLPGASPSPGTSENQHSKPHETQQSLAESVDADGNTDQVPQHAVEALKQRVTFTRETLVNAEAANTEFAVSLARQVEAYLDALLATHTDAE